MRHSLMVLFLFGFEGSAQAAVIASILPASNYNPDTAVMDASLGLGTEPTFEDFEDEVLAAGLWVTIPGHRGFTRVCGAAGGVLDEVWDGQCALLHLDETPHVSRPLSYN